MPHIVFGPTTVKARRRTPIKTRITLSIIHRDLTSTEIDHQHPALHSVMSSPLFFLAFAVIWFVLMRFVLPRFGVAT